ncbi:MAG: 5-deoxy-glucuronate isomerase [Streptosporangiales bacterium]|nr:5-deoxy-glucuronate isomerase [Streptosporangiales bacterium]
MTLTTVSAGAYTRMRTLELLPGTEHTFGTGAEEMCLLSLSGAATVDCDGHAFALTGRDGVFTGISDMIYLPRDAEVTVRSAYGGRFALPAAPCRNRLEPGYRPAGDVPVELRGAGNCSRQVNNFCSADSFEADRLIAVEVLTPAGNWSSYPPHKHDEDRPGECVLEEIYYFEVGNGPTGPGMGYQRVYGTPERPVDVLAEVRTGDAVLIEHGWHGPSMAVPGYDLYYLNVMAGPGPERAWLICDDPAHAWIRETWHGQEVDPRLPLTRSI